MSTPDSVQSSLVLPVIPRLTVVPRPVSQFETLRKGLVRLNPRVVTAAGLIAIETVAFFSGRVLAANLNTLMYIDTALEARIFGTLSFLSIVLIAVVIVLGHLALRTMPASERASRTLATVVLGAAYLHLVMWVTRVAAAAVATSALGSSAMFLPNVFWWG